MRKASVRSLVSLALMMSLPGEAAGLSYGGRSAHSPDEWLDVPVLLQTCRLAVELAAAT